MGASGRLYTIINAKHKVGLWVTSKVFFSITELFCSEMYLVLNFQEAGLHVLKESSQKELGKKKEA